MDRFDDDDLEDYQDMDLDEEPTVEEEEELIRLTPTVKAQLKDYEGFTDEDIREALWFNYMEIDPAVKEMKKKFKKKETKPPATKMSKLAQLRAAKKQQAAASASTGEPAKTSISILDRLKENKTAPVPTQTPKRTLPKRLRKPQTTTTPQATEEVSKRPRDEKDEMVIEQLPSPPPTQESSPEIVLPKLEVVDPFSQTPSSQFSNTFVPPLSKKRKIDHPRLYSVFLPTNPDLLAKVIQNFSKPSPDDVALQAQFSAFDQKKKTKELEKKIGDLKISAPKSSKPTKPTNPVDIKAELARRSSKKSVSFVMIGHVDAGKSTLTGRLLLETKTVNQSTYNKLQREAQKQGMSSFALAWIMDQTSEERERGVTIDICATNFETESCRFNIVDAPGHRDFVPNMITGVTQADVAVLVVDSSTDAFESGFNLDGQTKEHTILARSLGISKIIVAVNKLDNVDWNEHRFQEITGMMTEFLRMTGWAEDQISFVPCSGLTGVNVAKPADLPLLNQWYHGPTLLQQLEDNSVAEDKDYDKPFMLQILEVDESLSTFQGRVETGTIQSGESVKFAPSGDIGVVDIITLNGNKTTIAIAGDSVTLRIKNVSLENIKVGDVIHIVDSEVPSVSKFETRVVMFDMDRPLLVGMPFVLFRGNVQQPAKITKIVEVYDKNGGVDSKKKKIRHLSAKQSAYVIVETERKIPLQTYKENRLMGRLVLRKDGRTIGAGVVEKI